MRNPYKECVYYHKENNTCQSKKCATGGEGYITFIDKMFCKSYKLLREEENIMNKEDIFVKEKDIGNLILQNLFSEETEKFYNNCAFTSDRMAFMQGMNYAALLCIAQLEHYIGISYHELPKGEGPDV